MKRTRTIKAAVEDIKVTNEGGAKVGVLNIKNEAKPLITNFADELNRNYIATSDQIKAVYNEQKALERRIKCRNWRFAIRVKRR